MLYLHCGWPRTGTSSLQAVLFGHRDKLVEAGIDYPTEWMSEIYPTHHNISRMLEASLRGAASPFDNLERFFEARADRDVLLSAEVLTYWLRPYEKQEALLRFLEAATKLTGVRCIWALRRMDELLTSLYLLQLSVGADLPSPTEYFERSQGMEAAFAGMRRAEAVVRREVAYVKYDAAGGHLGELLRAFELPGRLMAEMQDELAGAPRLNSALTQKQAIALLHWEALSRRAGAKIDKASLRKAFYSDRVCFQVDRRCELVGDDVRRSLHEQALAAAARQGFRPYAEFFGADRIMTSTPTSLDSDLIDDEDLRRILAVAGVQQTDSMVTGE